MIKLLWFVYVKIQKWVNIPKIVPFVYLDVTNECNSPCKSCHIWKNKKDEAMLNTNEYIQLIPELKKTKTQVVSFAGGEVFLRKDMFLILKEYSKYFKTHLITNGSLLTKEKIDILKNIELSSICFSIDHTNKHDYYKIRGLKSFDHIYNILKYSCQVLNTSVNVTISQMNIDDIELIVDDLIKLKPQKIQFILATGDHQQQDISDFNQFHIKNIDGLSERMLKIRNLLISKGIQSNSKEFLEHFQDAYQKKWKYNCYAGDLFVLINHKGDVYSCYHKTKSFNIRDMKFSSIIKSKSHHKIIQSEVNTCDSVCHDNGKMEPSLRLHLSYALKNFYQSWREFKNL